MDAPIQSIPHTQAPRIKFARAVVFLASFFLMVVEIVAGRVTAPYLGVSIYTWTSVIGAVLLGVTVGNYLGGYVADRRLSRGVLGTCIFLGGLSTLAIGTIARMFGPMLAASGLPFSLTTALFSLLAFFPAAFFLSTVSPQVVKFDLHDLEKTGLTIGTIGAWSALGSIIGTFLTGFVFIAFIGTQKLLLIVAVALCLLGLFVAAQANLQKRGMLIATAVVGLLMELFAPGLCMKETNYYCIRVVQADSERGNTSYSMYLDHLVHSYTTPAEPDSFRYEYEYIHATLPSLRFATDTAFSTLTIGGGGYTMPRYLASFFTNATVEVAEIDPGVTEFNYTELGLPRDTTIQSHHGDARFFLSRLPADKTYDVIYGDAVNDFAVPYQITTREYHDLLKRHLSPGGQYVVTIIDDPEHAAFTAALLRTLRLTFRHVTFFPLGSEMFNGKGRNTFEIVASDEPFPYEQWSTARPVLSADAKPLTDEDWKALSTPLTEAELDAFLAEHPGPILTDDFAPTDQMLAAVFSDAYEPKRFE
jgi:MFS family permease